MGGDDPTFTDDDIMRPEREAAEIKFYKDSVISDYDRFTRDKERLFPGIDVVEKGYYDTPKKLQAEYKKQNPMLDKYWEWRDDVKRKNPRLATYMDSRSASIQTNYYKKYDNITDAIMSKVNDWTVKQLKGYIDYGWALNPKAERTLKQVYTNLQTPVPWDEWLMGVYNSRNIIK
jgi:hypothetical protein